MKTMALFFLMVPVLLLAGKTGTVTGKVTDAASGKGLTGVNVVIEGTARGAASDEQGEYTIARIPTGNYTLIASMMGYARVKVTDVIIKQNDTTRVNIQMKTTTIEGETVTVKAQRLKVMSDLTSSVLSKNRVSGYTVQGAPGRSSEFMMLAEQPAIDWNTEEYDKITENGFLEVLGHPMSTFAADVDAASYANVRRFIMQDQLPYKDAVRTEEFVNYFDYDYPEPSGGHPLSINIEYGQCPWNPENNLVHIGLQGKKLKREEIRPSNLVFLLDVSGSMNHPKKLPLLKKAFSMLVDQLNEQDRVAIAVYAGAAGLVLPSTPGSEKAAIKAAIEQLSAGGSTAGGAGIQLAYNVAKENFIKEGNNRVILATDGDFNVGISSTSELTRFIEERRNDGIFLTVLGFGMGNYKDHRLQELADRGNGNHAYIDNIMEAKKVLVHEITATLYTIAKDVKIQVEFNPARIASYRLIGYENRKLQDRDFKDDTKDAGEIGAGHTVTALYEVVPAGSGKNNKSLDLKYQTTTIRKDAAGSDEILTVRIRYKKPDEDKSIEFSKTLSGDPADPKKLSDNFRFSAAVAEFAMILRDSEFKAESSLQAVKQLARTAVGKDPYGYRAEFLTLVDRVGLLNDTKPEK